MPRQPLVRLKASRWAGEAAALRFPIPYSSPQVLRAGASWGILPRRAALVGNARVVLLSGLRGGLNGAVFLFSPSRQGVLSSRVFIGGYLRIHARGSNGESSAIFHARRGGHFISA